MKYLSTFTGIGGFELGINQAYGYKNNTGHATKQFTEEKGLLQDRNITLSDIGDGDGRGSYPICVGYSEIDKYATQIYQKHFPNHKNYGDITLINEKELPDFDLFVGGFPCQAFSIAGKRGGFDDTRGTLFFDCARILKEKQPRNFILENVKGLLSHDSGRTFKTIIATLTELGYCVEWQVLNAKNFGVPQNRERVFIVGHLGGIPERKVFPITTNGGANFEGNFEIIDGYNRNYTKEIGTVRQNMGNGGSLIANTLDANYAKGNSLSSERHTPRTQITEGTRIRRLTPLECERLMGFPDNWTDIVSDTQRYKTLGNGVVSNVVAEIVNRLYETQRGK